MILEPYRGGKRMLHALQYHALQYHGTFGCFGPLARDVANSKAGTVLTTIQPGGGVVGSFRTQTRGALRQELS
jgi:hypothetical protein